MFCKKGVLRKFAKFTGKYLCQRTFLNKVAGNCFQLFPVNFTKFLRTLFLQNSTGGWFAGVLLFISQKIRTAVSANLFLNSILSSHYNLAVIH